jgi:L-alanine-DL-glutamate epimerase-like enolase superfamily enzyme
VIITAVETWPIKIRPDVPYLGATDIEGEYYQRPPYQCLYSKNYEALLVKIETDEGVVGWGEALTPVGPEVVAEIINSLLSVVLIGKNPLNIAALWDEMYGSMRVRGHYTGFMLDAMAACDIALWDLKGQYLGCPLYQLLGGAYRERVPAYVSGLPEATLEGKVTLAKRWQEAGFNSIKLHAGYGISADLEDIAALRRELGDEVCLMLDGHWNYTLNEARELAARLKDYGVLFLEAPLSNPEDYVSHSELRASVDLDIALGEGERNRFQYRDILEKRAADILQPDIGRVGITEFLRIVHLAEAHGVRVAPHLSTHLGVAIAASIHLSAAIPNFVMLEYQPAPFELGNQYLEKPIECRHGYFAIPEGNGLGVRPDLEKLKCVRVA